MVQCDECKWCVLEDFGYSNYTVEGTYVHCLRGAHPNGPFDRWYGEDKRLEYANKCSLFVGGEPVELDCARDGQKIGDALSVGYAECPEVAKLLDEWDSRQ